MRIEKATDLLLVLADPFGQCTLAPSRASEGQVQRRLERGLHWNGHQRTNQMGSERDVHAMFHPSGDRFFKRIGSLIEGVRLVLAPGS